MAFKQFVIDDNLVIKIYKRKSSKNLRLTISPKGDVKVSIPVWAPYSSGLIFANSKSSWIKSQLQTPTIITNNQLIGKSHHLIYEVNPNISKPTSRVTKSELKISYPPSLKVTDAEVQEVAEKAALKAMRIQAEALLPQRIESISLKYGFSYKSVNVKLLKRRWGSCDSHKNIVFNLYLMQLPWQYIDYVIIHELVHTKVLKHGPDFWNAMSELIPNLSQVRKDMRLYQPILNGSPADAVA